MSFTFWTALISVVIVSNPTFGLFIRYRLKRKIKDRDSHLYPSLKEVKKASLPQLQDWILNLPIQSNKQEALVINEIYIQYLSASEQEKSPNIFDNIEEDEQYIF